MSLYDYRFNLKYGVIDTKDNGRVNMLKRKRVHLFISFLLVLVILMVNYLNNDNIISTLLSGKGMLAGEATTPIPVGFSHIMQNLFWITLD